MTVETRIGASLAALRIAADLTQEELAERSGMSIAAVRGIELGTVQPPVAQVAQLTAAIAARLRSEPG